MRHELIPAILAKTAAEARAKFEALPSSVTCVQLDALDGTLYRTTSWYDARTIRAWRVRPAIELHIMTRDPGAVIQPWLSVPNLTRVIWHVEAPIDHAWLAAYLHHRDIEAGLAIAPGTRIDHLTPYLEDIDMILVLGVHPGKSGQQKLSHTYERVDALHKRTRLPIGLDGGITMGALDACVRHGVKRIYTASALFNTPNVKKTYTDLLARL